MLKSSVSSERRPSVFETVTLTSHDFRLVASQALKDVLSRQDGCNCVIALPPSGLLGGYWKVVNETRDATIVVLRDAAENILGRITFYDIDSRQIVEERELSLLYVGCTRARERLFVTWSGQPSRFLGRKQS